MEAGFRVTVRKIALLCVGRVLGIGFDFEASQKRMGAFKRGGMS
jgi:hypothetical protein